MWAVLSITAVYILLNLYVTSRIRKAHYSSVERRNLHLKLIWVLPFVGPLLIIGYWRKTKNKNVVIMTKDQRKTNKGNFYESGIGQDGQS